MQFRNPSTWFACLALVLVSALTVVSGCQPAEEDSAPVSDLPKTEMKGQVDTTFAGRWVRKDKNQTIIMGEDGKVDIDSLIPTPNGMQETKGVGTWSYDGERVYFKTSTDKAPETTTSYIAKLDGEKMEFTSGKIKTPIIYERFAPGEGGGPDLKKEGTSDGIKKGE